MTTGAPGFVHELLLRLAGEVCCVRGTVAGHALRFQGCQVLLYEGNWLSVTQRISPGTASAGNGATFKGSSS